MEGNAVAGSLSTEQLRDDQGTSQTLEQEPQVSELRASEERSYSGTPALEPEEPGSQAPSISENPETISAHELHRLLLKAHRLGSALKLKFLGLLLTLEETRLYTQLGFPSTYAYASQYFGFERAETYEHLRVARALPALPASKGAFARGTLSWSALKELSRVADSETEAEWIELAKRASIEEFRAEVQHAIRTKRKRPRGKGYGLPGVPVRLAFTFEPAEYAIVERALELAAREAGEALGKGALKPKDALLYLATRVIEGLLGAELKSGGPRESPYAVLFKQCPDCKRTELKRPEGFVEVAPEVADRVAGEAVVSEIAPEEELCPEAESEAEHESDEVPPASAGGPPESDAATGLASTGDSSEGDSVPASAEAEQQSLELGAGSEALQGPAVLERGTAEGGTGGEHPLAAADTETVEKRDEKDRLNGEDQPDGKDRPEEKERWDGKDRPTPRSMARKIRLRDGGVCANPHCRSKKNLQCHHIRYRSRGGKTVLSNEISLCARCHALVHAGLLVIRGDPVCGFQFVPAGDRLRSNLERELEELSTIPPVSVVVNRAASAASCASGPGLALAGGEAQPAGTSSLGDREASAPRRGAVVEEVVRGPRSGRGPLAELPWGPVAVLEKLGYSKKEAAERVWLAMQELEAQAKVAGGNGNGSGEVKLDENKILNRALRIRKKILFAPPV